MKKCIRDMLLLAFIFATVLGYALNEFNIFLIAAMSIWLGNIVFSLEALNRRFYFLMFEVTFFVFLLSRPFISFCRGDVWWKLYGEKHVWFALEVIVISQVSLMVGAWFIEEWRVS